MFKVMHSYEKPGSLRDATQVNTVESIAEAKRWVHDNYFWANKLEEGGPFEFEYVWWYGLHEIGYLWLEAL